MEELFGERQLSSGEEKEGVLYGEREGSFLSMERSQPLTRGRNGLGLHSRLWGWSPFSESGATAWTCRSSGGSWEKGSFSLKVDECLSQSNAEEKGLPLNARQVGDGRGCDDFGGTGSGRQEGAGAGAG